MAADLGAAGRERSHFLLAVAGAVVARGTPYLALLIAARLLPAGQFGAFALATVAAGLLGVLVSGGGGLWTNRFAARAGAAAGWRDALRFRYLQLALLLAALVALAAAVLAAADGAPPQWRALIPAVAAAAVVAGLGEALYGLLRSTGRLAAFFLLRDLAAPLGYLALLLAVAPAEAAGAVALAPAAGLPGLAVAALLLHGSGHLWPAAPLRRRCRGRRLVPLGCYTARLLANSLAGRLALQLDVLALGLVVGIAEVGHYRAAAQLALGFLVVQHAVFLGLPWQLRRQGRGAERAARLAALRARQGRLSVAAGAALLLVWAFPAPILALFGPAFVELADLLRLLALIRFLELLWGPQAQLLISNGRAGDDSRAWLAAIGAWLAGFAALSALVAPLAAAAGAQAVASAAAQLVRRRALAAAGHGAAAPGNRRTWWLVLCSVAALGMTALVGA